MAKKLIMLDLLGTGLHRSDTMGTIFYREVGKMIEKKIFVEPELIKYEESLDEVTLLPPGSVVG